MPSHLPFANGHGRNGVRRTLSGMCLRPRSNLRPVLRNEDRSATGRPHANRRSGAIVRAITAARQIPFVRQHRPLTRSPAEVLLVHDHADIADVEVVLPRANSIEVDIMRDPPVEDDVALEFQPADSESDLFDAAGPLNDWTGVRQSLRVVNDHQGSSQMAQRHVYHMNALPLELMDPTILQFVAMTPNMEMLVHNRQRLERVDKFLEELENTPPTQPTNPPNCHICADSSREPFTCNFCKQVVGCRACVVMWVLSTCNLDLRCPLCRGAWQKPEKKKEEDAGKKN